MFICKDYGKYDLIWGIFGLKIRHSQMACAVLNLSTNVQSCVGRKNALNGHTVGQN